MGSRPSFLRFGRIVQHVLAEVALLLVGAIDGVAALGIAILAAADIFGRAGRNLAAGAAEGVVVLGQRRIIGRHLSATGAGAKRERRQHQRNRKTAAQNSRAGMT